MLEDELRHDLLELADVLPQLGHFIRRRLARGVPEQPLLPGFEKLLAPPVVEVRIQPFPPTQRRDAFFTPQSLEDNPNVLFRRELAAGLPTNLLNDLLC